MPNVKRKVDKRTEIGAVTTSVVENGDGPDGNCTNTDTGVPTPASVRRTPDARGRECIGIAPDVSRTKLSKATGCHKSQVSNVLAGRTEASTKLIRLLAPWIGVTEQVLDKKLKMQRAVYLASELGELERAKRKDASASKLAS